MAKATEEKVLTPEEYAENLSERIDLVLCNFTQEQAVTMYRAIGEHCERLANALTIEHRSRIVGR